MHQHINMKPKNGIETHNISKKETDFNENFPLFVFDSFLNFIENFCKKVELFQSFIYL